MIVAFTTVSTDAAATLATTTQNLTALLMAVINGGIRSNKCPVDCRILPVLLEYLYALCRFAQCRYAECRYSECRGASADAKQFLSFILFVLNGISLRVFVS